MINEIEIQNIKGISSKKFMLDILPNRPSLLVAPNGFGKSSFATAFNSMNNNRINLHEDDFHTEKASNLPEIQIIYTKPDNTRITLGATNTTNTISSEFAYFVINNLTKPKGNASTYGGFANSKASLIIEDVTLVDNIPQNTTFSYSYKEFQAQFGSNAKVLPNLNSIFSNLKLIEVISENFQALERANQKTMQDGINTFIEQINQEKGTTKELIEWIPNHIFDDLKEINYISTLGDIIHQFDLENISETESYLIAIQLIWLYNNGKPNFKKACLYNNYKLDKEKFNTTLSTFNSSWKTIRASESGGKLIVRFPKAIHISNGQRDILTFISMLFRAKRKLTKEANILIIDEVFDYLDDANLIAAQYYVTQFIQEFKDLGKRIYPLILTHLNPNYFKNFAFKKQKVYYLDKSTVQVNPHMTSLLRNRNNSSIKDDVSRYLLHFHPTPINKKTEFIALGLLQRWGEGDNFRKHVNNQLDAYLSNQPYDPFAVCGALRLQIEETAYNKLQTASAKTTFLDTHLTRKKLEAAENLGVVSPESHYLLGIIYNEGMHWKDNQDNVSPIASKLENLVLKKLIRDVFE